MKPEKKEKSHTVELTSLLRAEQRGGETVPAAGRVWRRLKVCKAVLTDSQSSLKTVSAGMMEKSSGKITEIFLVYILSKPQCVN